MSFNCPHCGEALGGEHCPACDRFSPEGSRYCCWCGDPLDGDTAPPDDREWTAEDDDGPIDFASRTLCSDGSCIGVIGSDGHCKECGKAYSGEPEEG
jgi:hypothetical protein